MTLLSYLQKIVKAQELETYLTIVFSIKILPLQKYGLLNSGIGTHYLHKFSLDA